MQRPLHAWLVLVLAACDTGGPSADAGVDAREDAGGDELPAPPQAAAPVSLEPCPDGWRLVSGECDPWPAGGRREDCAFDEAHFPGRPGCERVGTACPADGWPADLPLDRPVVYVDDDAAPGGDGTSRERALRTVAEASAAAPPGAVLALATGRYDEEIVLRGGHALVGACVAGTRVTSSDATATRGTITAAEPGAAVRDLSVDAPERLGVVGLAADFRVEDVVVSAATSAGLLVARGSTSVERLVVRDTRAGSGAARGIIVQGGAQLSVAWAVLERSAEAGLVLSSGGIADIADLAVEDTRPRPGGGLGHGVVVQSGGQLTLERAAIERSRQFGLVATSAASVVARDLVIRGTLSRESDGADGRGADINGGASLTLERALLAENRDVGLFVSEPDTIAELRDVVVRDTAPAIRGDTGLGVDVSRGARAILDRVLVRANRSAGLQAGGDGTYLEARDLTVRDTRSQDDDGTRGAGIGVTVGAHVVLERVLLERNRSAGLSADGHGTLVDARDVVVRETGSQEVDTLFGRGVNVEAGARLVLERALVEDNHDTGLFLGDEGTEAEVRDLVVRGLAPGVTDALGGMGVWAQDGARLALTRARVERSRLAGVASVEAFITLSGVRVIDVRPSECAATTCPALAGGFGLAAQFGGVLTAVGFHVEAAALCGVVVGEDAIESGARTAMDLERGAIESAPVGACIQVDGYETTRLRRDVAYRDVGVALQATSYELPSRL